MSLVGIIAFIIIFGIIVAIHEFGHFVVAKKSGVFVHEFAIGMGPKLFSTKKNDTVYTLRALPIGGYVRLGDKQDISQIFRPGMQVLVQTNEQNKITAVYQNLDANVQNETFLFQISDVLYDQLALKGYLNNENNEETFLIEEGAIFFDEKNQSSIIPVNSQWLSNAKVYKRILINIAGPLMNGLLALAAFLSISIFSPAVYNSSSVVGGIQENSPAQLAGLQVKDKITSINNTNVSSFQQVSNIVSQLKANQSVSIAVLRNQATIDLSITPQVHSVDGQDVVYLGVEAQKLTSIQSRIADGFAQTGNAMTLIFRGVYQLITHPNLNELGGPVAIARVTNTVTTSAQTQSSILPLISFLGLLSANLGIMNLLPIPGLDGGKLLLNIIEAIRRKPLSQKSEMVVTAIGAAILITLMIAVTINDLLRK